MHSRQLVGNDLQERDGSETTHTQIPTYPHASLELGAGAGGQKPTLSPQLHDERQHQKCATGVHSNPGTRATAPAFPPDLTELAALWEKLPAAVREGWIVTARALAGKGPTGA